MQKEVIYLDNDDDITTIIDKLKAAEPRIIAFVPPSRIGVLQSAVNLKLLSRIAEKNGKRIVIISNNEALSTLAASAKIPVARNLQSKPELAVIPALDVDNGDDVIDGIDLPVGEHISTREPKDSGMEKAVGEIAKEDDDKSKKKNKSKIPNFNSFRKKLVLVMLGVLLLGGFLYWAVAIAPSAKITVSMRTSEISINQIVGFSTTEPSSVEKSILRASTISTDQEISQSFKATGEKNVGDKASGAVRISTDAITILTAGLTVPAGTEVSSVGGRIFITDESAVFAKGDASGLSGRVVGVIAKEGGASFNGATGMATTSAQGVSSVVFTEPTAGGTDEIVKVVTAEDISTAKRKAEADINKQSAETKLKSGLGDDIMFVAGSIDADFSKLESSIKVDAEAKNGEAIIMGTIKFSALTVSTGDLTSYLTGLLEKQLDNPDAQRIYENGVKTAKFDNFRRDSNNVTASLSTVGKIGPRIDEARVIESAKGKLIGEVVESIGRINGVSNVDVETSPFWVRSVPSNPDKITVEFKVDG